jgi:hypothetical protein
MPSSSLFPKLILVIFCAVFLVVVAGLGAIWTASPELHGEGNASAVSYEDKTGDQELAYLLTKLELRTRAVMAGHYTASQSAVPGVDFLYQRWIARNRILPAAVAGDIFADVVPGATGDRAWVKMVVDPPRNPKNLGDETALSMLKEMQAGAKVVERTTADAYYYGEPIVAKTGCLPCHGEAQGDPDPVFPQYHKDGWKDGDVIGAVVSRVAPELPRN